MRRSRCGHEPVQKAATPALRPPAALASSREESWKRLIEGECGIGPVTVFDVEGYRSRVAGEVDLDAATAGRLSALERRRWSRGVIVDRRRGRRGRGAGRTRLMVSGSIRGASASCSARASADLLRNERYFATTLTDGIERARPSDAESLSSTPADIIASAPRPRRTALLHRTASVLVQHHRHWAGRRRHLGGHADAAVAGGTDALSRPYSGQRAAPDGSWKPCRLDRSRAGMNIGEGAGILILEDMIAPSAAARTSTASWPAAPAARRSSDRA